LRWDWTALHLFPKIEFYAQCADIEVVSSSSLRPSDLNGFSIIAPPVYPLNGQDGVGFRSPYGGEYFVTGPACFDDSINACGLTAKGTRGYTGFGGAPSLEPAAPTSAPPSPSPATEGGAAYPPAPGSSSPAPQTAPSPAAASGFTMHDGACRTADGGKGTTDVSTKAAAMCRDMCASDAACAAVELGPDDRCELHRLPIYHADAAVRGFECWIRGDVAPAPAPGGTRDPSVPPPAPAPAPTPAGACAKVKYAQCGGEGFAGDACCPAGMWCMYGNAWWSQCEPCDETWDATCESAVALGQLHSAHIAEHVVDPGHDVRRARPFLGSRAPRAQGVMLLHIGGALHRPDHAAEIDASPARGEL